MTTFITILILLAGAGWWFYCWYGKPYLAAQKWAKEKRQYLKQQRAEERAAHEAEQAKEFASRLRAADTAHQAQARLIDAAERVRRQRTGENLIYDDSSKRRFLDDRSGGKIANRIKLDELLRAQASLQDKVRQMEDRTNNSTNLS